MLVGLLVVRLVESLVIYLFNYLPSLIPFSFTLSGPVSSWTVGNCFKSHG